MKNLSFEHTPAGVMIEKNSIRDVVFKMSFHEMRKYLLTMYLWNSTSNVTLDDALREAERQLKSTERKVDSGLTAKVILEKTEYFLNEKRENYEKMCNPVPEIDSSPREPLKKKETIKSIMKEPPTKTELELIKNYGVSLEQLRQSDALFEYYSQEKNHLPLARKLALYLKKRGDEIVPMNDVVRVMNLPFIAVFYTTDYLEKKGLIRLIHNNLIVCPKLYDAWDMFLDSESLEREFFALN